MGIFFEENVITSKLSAIKVGGAARFITYPKNIEELRGIIQISRELRLPHKVIGGLSNTFFSDDGYKGILISLKRMHSIIIGENSFKISAGEPLSGVIRHLSLKNISFLPELIGIPGTVGGAVRNNAGAFSKEISEAFLLGEFYDPSEDKVFYLDKKDLNFSYRSSLLQRSDIILLNAEFASELRSCEECGNIMHEIIAKRKASHPKEPSLGSFFKRSGNVIPSLLIDKAGLKGFSVGGAEVSKKHAGFIINKGKATAKDVLDLSYRIEEKIKSIFGVSLEREAEYVK